MIFFGELGVIRNFHILQLVLVLRGFICRQNIHITVADNVTCIIKINLCVWKVHVVLPADVLRVASIQLGHLVLHAA